MPETAESQIREADMERLIRIGRVSKINKEKGMISVTYPDLDDSTTAEFPVFSFTDEYKMPQIGQSVLVLHLSNGQSAGIVLGRYWNETNKPPVSSGFRKELGKEYGEAYIEYQNNTVKIHAKEILLDGLVSAPEDVTAQSVSLINHTHTDSIGGSTTKPR